MHRVAWDLRYASKNVVRLRQQSGGGNWWRRGGGLMATPGTYTVTLSKVVDGVVTDLAGPQSFNVVPLRESTLEGASAEEIIAFREELEELQGDVAAANYMLDHSMDKIAAIKTALSRSDKDMPELYTEVYNVRMQLMDLDEIMNGNRTKQEIGEKTHPTISNRMYTTMRGLRTTYGPTPLHRTCLEIAQADLGELMPMLRDVAEKQIPALEEALESAGAPWIEGMSAPDRN